MSEEKELQAAPVYPTPAPVYPTPAPVSAPVHPHAPVYPVPVTAPVPPTPVYPTPVTATAYPAPPVHPAYTTPLPAAKLETSPYIYPTTAPLPPVPAPAAQPSGKQYQDQLLSPCAAGHHDPTTKFGTCGIITAICCFPFGLLCLCVDKETRCARCGVLLL